MANRHSMVDESDAVLAIDYAALQLAEIKFWLTCHQTCSHSTPISSVHLSYFAYCALYIPSNTLLLRQFDGQSLIKSICKCCRTRIFVRR